MKGIPEAHRVSVVETSGGTRREGGTSRRDEEVFGGKRCGLEALDEVIQEINRQLWVSDMKRVHRRRSTYMKGFPFAVVAVGSCCRYRYRCRCRFSDGRKEPIA